MNLVIYVTFLTSIIIPVIRSYGEEKARKKNLEMGLSLVSFKKVLADPAMVREFKRFCIGDFSVENIMFYEEVQHLKAKVLASPSSQFVTSTQPMSEDPLRSTHSTKQSFLHRKLFSTPDEPRGSIETIRSDPTTSMRTSVDSNDPKQPETQPPSFETHRPVPASLKSSFFLVHRTFTSATSPLEINIPADVRHAVALAFETGQVTVDVFDRACEYVVDNMFYNSFAKFYAKMAVGNVRRRRVLG
ncbi:RGS domain-containing protein [Chytridium lagenaria]|nr:RGS domain-containing protein [Chytridium lagenaria]